MTYDNDVVGGQMSRWVQSKNGRVIPLRNLPEEDGSERVGREIQWPVKAANVVAGHNCGDCRCDMQETYAASFLRPFQFGVGKGHIGEEHVDASLDFLFDCAF
jgi:hypothetical protein